MVDPIDTVKSVLEDNWTAGNTDSLTPTFDFIVNQKELINREGDFVLLYEVDEAIKPFGMGGTRFEYSPVISIDIRTTYKIVSVSDIRAHLIKLKDEVFRIINLKILDPDSDYRWMLLVRKKDLSDKRSGLGRMVIDVKLYRYAA